MTAGPPFHLNIDPPVPPAVATSTNAPSDQVLLVANGQHRRRGNMETRRPHAVRPGSPHPHTLLVSTEENRPKNATLEQGVTWLDWGAYLDGQLTWRFLLRRDPKLVALHDAIVSGKSTPEIAPYVPVARHVSKKEFESGDWKKRF